MAPVLECEGVRRTFATPGAEVAVLRGVDLRVDAGEVVAILGPSGSGKSTLLHVMAGLDSVDAGIVRWGGVAVQDRRPRELARLRSRALGLVFQNHYLLKELSLLENVMLPGRIIGALDAARAQDLLERMGLEARASFRPDRVSGGERQRAAVARALALDPPLLLADEPTGSLDRDNALRVFALLREVASERGSAVVLVTHDEDLVRDVARRYRLEHGKLMAVA